ncbi:hypothetical protein Clacol_000682 [Clathrus columnatus]|uniref:Uncharacterized protein n=1 Tax=Clathrus columnatus TaxID=1419009 RepID=A0AAV5A3L6_9AGAM|nr:hypothetical protein Clacol_000682 [Clathrus columnatus]
MDDPFDYDYVEQDYDEESAVETTPSSRLQRDSGLTDETKNRVRNNDPNQGRCLIENCLELRSIDFCHCVPRSFTYKRSDLMSNIEWHWNMKYYSLNLDSSHNIFRAGVSVHRLFDNDNYMLVPETNVVNQYHKALKRVEGRWVATRKTFPNIPVGTHKEV